MSKHTTPPVSVPTPPVSSAADTVASTARFTLPAEGFALAEFFERVPDARVECESAVANPTDHALLVVRADNRENLVDTALRADASVATVERFGERADGWTYRVTWEGRPRRLIQRLVATDVTLVSARGRDGEWQLRLLAPNREGIGRAHEIMDDLDCEDKCRSVCNLDGDVSNRSELTSDQHEALVEAFKAGYYCSIENAVRRRDRSSQIRSNERFSPF